MTVICLVLAYPLSYLIVRYRGKLAMFQKVFFDADLDFFVGAAFVGVEERADAVGQPAPGNVTFSDIPVPPDARLPSKVARSKRTAIAPSFGIALSAFCQDFLGISLRWRGIPFKYNTGGTDNNNDGQIDSSDRLKQFNNMFTIGLTFVLPPKMKTTD